MEIKIKSNNLIGSKKRYNLRPFILNNNYSLKKFKNNLIESKVNKEVVEYLSIFNLCLLNSYKRKYYISKDKNFRITIDFSMKYFRIKQFQNNIFPCINDNRNIVLELKYPQNFDNYANKITNNLPFRLTKEF